MGCIRLVLLLLLLDCASVTACIWSYGTNMAGEIIDIEGGLPGPFVPATDSTRRAMRLEAESDRLYLEERIRVDNSIRNRNDLAVVLMRLGRIDEALLLLQSIEQESPGLYATASNLGTAYELGGNNIDALYWIREGIRRNPASHHGTEWLHVRILQAKIALADDPDWLVHNRIVDAGTGSAGRPHPPSETDSVLSSLYSAIEYQLSERMKFVAPPDPIIAQLLFELGNLKAHRSSLEEALYTYDEALSYGPADSPFVQRRRDVVAEIVRENKIDITLREGLIESGKAASTYLSLGGVLALFVAGVAGMVWLIRRQVSGRKRGR